MTSTTFSFLCQPIESALIQLATAVAMAIASYTTGYVMRHVTARMAQMKTPPCAVSL